MRQTWTLVWVLLVAACAPVKETRYHFLPPQDAPGQACVTQCSATHSACLREADKAAAGERDLCEMEARQDYDVCLARPPLDAQVPCQLRRCEIAGERAAACDPTYRACFQACGGQVQTQEICLLNCD